MIGFNNMPYDNQPIPVVSAIIERENNGRKEILIQTRWKPKRDQMYSGTFEIPAGVIEKYENILDALKREVREETGLEVEIKNLKTSKTYKPQGDDESFAFIPFCGQQQTKQGKPWIGFVFVCNVKGGKIKAQEDEVKDIKWIPIEEVKEMLKNPKQFFALQIGVLELYLSYLEDSNNIR